jgi:hypothetical protein
MMKEGYVDVVDADDDDEVTTCVSQNPVTAILCIGEFFVVRCVGAQGDRI